MHRTTGTVPPLAAEPAASSPLAARLANALASRRAAVVIPLVGALLTVPSLVNGLAFDDLAIRLRARGVLGDTLWTRLDVFAFFPADPASKARLADEGLIPWFAAPDLHITFLRPLSAVLHAIDYTLLDRWPWVMHLESVALYAGLVAFAGALYRRMLPPGLAALATLLYALDPGHGMPVGWLANRNALVAAAFGIAAVIAHDRSRRDGWRPGALVGPLAFLGALLGGESGLGAMAYVTAHAATLDPGSTRDRLKALAPYGAIVAGWQVVYRVLGYGAHGTGLYDDPLVGPVHFALGAPVRALTLLLGQLVALPAEGATFFAVPGRVAIALAGLALSGLVAWALRARLRSSGATRFFALGVVLSLGPIVATVPASRLLVFASIGASAIVADVIGDLRVRAPAGAPGALRRLFLVVHVALAPLVLVGTVLASGLAGRWVAPLPIDKGRTETVVLLDVPTIVAVIPWTSIDPSERRRVRTLAATTGDVDVTREDARTLLVELAPSARVDPATLLFRDDAHPLRPGETYDSPGMRGEVLRVDDEGHATSVRYRFERDLDDRSYRWVTWSGAFVDTVPPSIGETICASEARRRP